MLGRQHSVRKLAVLCTLRPAPPATPSQRVPLALPLTATSTRSLALLAGDHIAVFAENSPAVVEAAAKALGLPLNHCFRLALPANDPHCLSEPFPGENAGVCVVPVGGGVVCCTQAFAVPPSQVL